MREIKFKAVFEGKVREVYQINFDSNGDIKDVHLDGGDVVVCTLIQFTGLTDKNGKEIYEGDVIKGFLANGYVERIGYKGESKPKILVRWDLDGFCWEILGKDKRYVHENDRGTIFADMKWEASLIDEKEIIGNIHENPNLLK